MIRLSRSLNEAALKAARDMQSQGVHEITFEHARANYKIRKIRDGPEREDERFMGRVQEQAFEDLGIYLRPHGTH